MSKRLAQQCCVGLTFMVVLAAHVRGVQAADLAIVPDPTFGNGGYVADHLDPNVATDDSYRNFTVDRDGRAIGLGNTAGQRFVVGRYTLAGRPDPAFAKTGKATVCLEPKELAATAPENDGDRIQFSHGGIVDGKGR